MPIRRSSAKRSLMPPLTMSFELDDAEDVPGRSRHDEGRRALLRDLGDLRANGRRGNAPARRLRRRPRIASDAPLRICRPSTSTPLMRVWAVNGTKYGAAVAQVALADLEPLLREHDDAPALGRLVGERRELRRVGEVLLADAGRRMKRGRLPVARA